MLSIGDDLLFFLLFHILHLLLYFLALLFLCYFIFTHLTLTSLNAIPQLLVSNDFFHVYLVTHSFLLHFFFLLEALVYLLLALHILQLFPVFLEFGLLVLLDLLGEFLFEKVSVLLGFEFGCLDVFVVEF